MRRSDPSRPSPLVQIVDDCIEQRDLYELALERDFEIVTAARGVDAIALAIARQPDAIVLDLRMPGMDGLVVCRHLKRDPVTADIPVIILTGDDDHGVQTEALIAGAAAVLTKPCSAPRLIGTLRAAVDRSATGYRFK
jgi:CheY-like chemotaxis protein